MTLSDSLRNGHLLIKLLYYIVLHCITFSCNMLHTLHINYRKLVLFRFTINRVTYPNFAENVRFVQ